MRRDHLEPGSEKKARDHIRFLEKLIVNYFDRQSESDGDSVAGNQQFENDKVYERVIHAIERRETRRQAWRTNLRIAASVVLVISLAIYGIYQTRNISDFIGRKAMIEKTAEKGETLQVKLKDGTKIWLNSGSKLAYASSFEDGKREVTLVGEAYFEVVHNEKQPFIIQSGEVKTVVLGTSFNIRAYPENRKVEVTVISGKVAVITPKGKTEAAKTVYLTPNQRAVYSYEKVDIKPSLVNAEEAIEWKESKLVFAGTHLAQVIEAVEKKYTIKLQCSDRIRECPITVDLTNMQLDNVLKVMARLIDGSISEKNGVYYLDGTGCE